MKQSILKQIEKLHTEEKHAEIIKHCKIAL